LIELRHELAEQIKEKTRQNAHLAALNGSNGFSTSSTSSSIPIDLENPRANGNAEFYFCLFLLFRFFWFYFIPSLLSIKKLKLTAYF
jgi:hypothetical protein